MKKALIIGLLIFVLHSWRLHRPNWFNDGTSSQRQSSSAKPLKHLTALSVLLYRKAGANNSLRTEAEMNDLDMVLSYTDQRYNICRSLFL